MTRTQSYLCGCHPLVLGLLALFLLALPAHADIISQLTDPEHPAVEEGLDILEAQVEQNGGFLTFSIWTRGDIPTELTYPEDVVTFLWLIDTDEDPSTGQPHGPVGSEFNVRATISEVHGGGFVDVCGGEPGGGNGEVTVVGNLITIQIGMSQIASPADFNWLCSSFHIENGVWVSGNPESEMASAVTLPYTPPDRVTVTTPILQLCPTGPATGQIEVELRDVDGNVLPVEDYILDYTSTNPAVATVDDDGVVTAVAPPVGFWDTPYILVSADGKDSDNSAVIRVTDIPLDVVHLEYGAEHVSFFLPAVIEGIDLEAVTLEYEIVQATELAYVAQVDGVGGVPFHGCRHYFVLDVTNDPVTVPCGISGSPIRLGWTWGQGGHNNCFVTNGPDRRPHWFVVWHEMGHNVTLACASFGQFCNGPSGQHNLTYVEGLGSLAAMWSWKAVMTAPGNLGATALDDIDEHLGDKTAYFRLRLAEYQDAGADYDTIDPDIIDGIFMEMYDVYGVRPWYDLFSTFLPSTEGLPLPLDTRDKQATWVVAAMSVSAGQDLRPLFTADYGFPIDEAAWSSIYSAVETRILARPYAPAAVEEPPWGIPIGNGTLVCAPNPFSPRTEIRYLTAKAGRVSLTVYDVRGRRVATLLAGQVPAGGYTVRWDGRDDRGRVVAAGTYVARLTTTTGVSTVKLMLLR